VDDGGARPASARFSAVDVGMRLSQRLAGRFPIDSRYPRIHSTCKCPLVSAGVGRQSVSTYTCFDRGKDRQSLPLRPPPEKPEQGHEIQPVAGDDSLALVAYLADGGG
jgi:hypothetical protein